MYITYDPSCYYAWSPVDIHIYMITTTLVSLLLPSTWDTLDTIIVMLDLFFASTTTLILRGKPEGEGSYLATILKFAMVLLLHTKVIIANRLKDDKILLFWGENSLRSDCSTHLYNTNSKGALGHTTLPHLLQKKKVKPKIALLNVNSSNHLILPILLKILPGR